MKYKVDETEHNSLIIAYLDLYTKTLDFVLMKVGGVGLTILGVIIFIKTFQMPEILAIVLMFGVPLVMTTHNFCKTIKEAKDGECK